jgi:hypothetical protein
MAAASPYGPTDLGSREVEDIEQKKSERVVRALLRRARAARKDPAAFFEFVMKEERTGAPMKCAPHQRVLFSFVDHHPRTVVRMPIGSSKTYCMTSLGLWLLGNDPTERGAIISASEGQSKKPLSMIQDYIEDERGTFPELHLVFPELRPSPRAKDPWQQNRIVVDRPPGIRDPSVAAIGFGGKLPGSRLSWILVDDILTEENTRTADSREQVNRWVGMTVLSRRDVEKSRIVVTNTPYNSGSGGRDSGDVTFMLEKAGWPTLTMNIEGDITIANADADWDCPDIRPAFWGEHPGNNRKKSVEVYRLTSHDAASYGAPAVVVDAEKKRERRATPVDVAITKQRGADVAHYDLDETIPLWPEKYSIEVLERLRLEYREQYAPLYKCICRDDATALCKKKWIETCKALAYRAGFDRLVNEYNGQNATITGIDLAFGEDEQHDWTCHFTIELIPLLEIPGFGSFRNLRRVLDVEYGKIDGVELRDRSIMKRRRYRSFLKVETNGGQKLLLDMIKEKDLAIPVFAHTTGKNKHHRHLGIRGFFAELENGAWLIPSNVNGDVAEPVQRWIDGCLEYAPNKHTEDGLMASWIARTMALEFDGVGMGEDYASEIARGISVR